MIARQWDEVVIPTPSAEAVRQRRNTLDAEAERDAKNAIRNQFSAEVVSEWIEALGPTLESKQVGRITIVREASMVALYRVPGGSKLAIGGRSAFDSDEPIAGPTVTLDDVNPLAPHRILLTARTLGAPFRAPFSSLTLRATGPGRDQLQWRAVWGGEVPAELVANQDGMHVRVVGG